MQCRFSKARIIDTFFSGLVFSLACDVRTHWRPKSVAGGEKNEATEKPLGIPSKTTEIIANHL